MEKENQNQISEDAKKFIKKEKRAL